MKKFFKSAAFLAAAGAAAKLLGALHKLPLMTLLGAEGTGLYQLVFPVYAAVLAVTSGGVTQAVSRAAAAEGGEAPSSLAAGVIVTAVAGAAGSIFLAAAGGFIARLQGNAAAAPAYSVLAPAVAFSCVISAFRGWWQGRRNMFPTAASQIAEQSVKLAAGLGLARALSGRGVSYAVAGAIGGITLSEAAAAAALLIGYFATVHGRPAQSLRPLLPAVRGVCRDAFPIAAAALVMPVSQFADGVAIVNLLAGAGTDVSAATSLYGVVTAPVSAITGFMTVFTSAAAAALMPRLSGSDGVSDKRAATGGALSAALLVGLSGAALLAVFPDEIVRLLYPAGLTDAEFAAAVAALRLSAPGALSLCLMQIAVTALQASGKAHIPALVLLCAVAVKCGLTVIAVSAAGAAGSAAANSAAFAAALAADAFFARKYLRGCLDKPSAIKIVCAAAAGAAAGAAAKLLPTVTPLGACAVCGGVFLLAAALVVVATDCFSVNSRLCGILKKYKILPDRFAKKSKKY